MSKGILRRSQKSELSTETDRRTYVWVKTSFEGYHCWPDAPKERAYLRQEHRHIFHIRLALLVRGHDREAEFHDILDGLRYSIAHYWKPAMAYGKKCSWSCEHLANLIADRQCLNGYTDLQVEVSEDGECGAIVVHNEEGE